MPQQTKIPFVALLMGALLAACSGGGDRQPPQPATSAEAEAQHLAFTVPEGRALVTVYRPMNFVGALQIHKILINGRHVASMHVNTRHSEPVLPGGVTVEAVWWPYSPKLAFTAEAGAAYFIKLSPNLIDAGPQLAHAKPAAAAAAAKMRPAAQP